MKKKGQKLILFLGAATLALHTFNKISYKYFTKKNLLLNTENFCYDWRFGQIRYIKKGQSSPVLLLHDLTLGSSLYEYHKIINKLAKKHEVYAIDLLGYGLSEKPNLTYTNYLYVQLVTDFTKQVIKRKTSIVASNDAAPIAIMACQNDADIIDKIISINPQDLYSLSQIPNSKSKLLKRIYNLPILGTFLFNLKACKKSITNSFTTDYFYNPELVTAEMVATYTEAAHIKDYHSKYSYTSYIGNYMNTNILHAIKKIDNSIFIIAGAEVDNIRTIVSNYRYFNPSIEKIYITKTKRYPQLEKPDSVIRNILTFLDTL